MTGNSVTRWIHELRNGDEEAAEKIFDRYWDRLVEAARRHLRREPRPLNDEEDLAQSVLRSLCRGAAEGRLNGLANRDELWRLLIALTRQKAIDESRHEGRVKRGRGKTKLEADFEPLNSKNGVFSLEELASESPQPEFIIMIEEEASKLLALLRNDSLRQIAIWRMEGFTVAEIAAKMNLYTRAIERKLKLIRETWNARLVE